MTASTNPRADVNQDGIVNSGDLLAVRAIGTWGGTVVPEWPPLPYRVQSYDGPDQNGCIVDVRNPRVLLADTHYTSTAHAIVADFMWNNDGLTVTRCLVTAMGYGIYSGVDRLTVSKTIIQSRQRDPIRITGGTGILIEDVLVGPTEAAAAFRIHGNATDIVLRRMDIFATNPWGLDVGEQYAGAGGIVKNVLLEDCRIIACPQTVMGVRVRGQNVVLRRCHGLGFSRAQAGAPLVQVERHSCDPTGCRLEQCTVDGGHPLTGATWKDTVVI